MNVLITGIAGQDGFFLAQEASRLGWNITGTKLPQETLSIGYPEDKFIVKNLDFSNTENVKSFVETLDSLDLVFHLAGRSSVAESWKNPYDYFQVNSLGSITLMQNVLNSFPNCKIILAGSAEIFDPLAELPWDSLTRKAPTNPYGLSKLLMYEYGKKLKDDNYWVSTAFLFNHESPRRSMNFLSKKIVSAVGQIHLGNPKIIELENLESLRDWGYAPEYMQALVQLSQLSEPTDVAIGTGKLSSVRDFLSSAFLEIGISDWSKMVTVSASSTIGTSKHYCDTNEAESKIGWRATTLMPELARLLVRSEINEILKTRNEQ